MPEKTLLDRDLYRKIKRMDKAQLNRVLNNIYEQGREDAAKEFTVTEINYNKIRSEISGIKGIGDVRLNRIMEIIHNNLDSDVSNDT